MKTAWMLTAVVALAAAVGGCQQYVNAPAIPTSKGIPDNPNKPAAVECIRLAVQYVATRYPPGSVEDSLVTEKGRVQMRAPYQLVVNMPRGMRKSFYERTVKEVGPLAEPMTQANAESGLPTFHVTRVWMRFNEATVDVLRPMPEMGPGADGKPVYQTVTVRLEGGMEPWRVVHARAWPPSDVVIPPPYYLPDVERIEQYKWQIARDKESGLM